MSILIKGRKMPGGCRQCEFCRFGGVHCELNVCRFTGQSQDSHLQGRLTDCPLIEIPDGHGKLIDADALFEEAYKVWGFDADAGDCNILMGLILDAPTVIPSDKDGEI